MISVQTHCSFPSMHSSQHPHCFCFLSLSGHFRLSVFMFSQIAKNEPEQELPSLYTMVGADPSQLTHGGLLVALLQRTW